MGISVCCSSCSAVLRVKDELAGRRGKCPKCQGSIQIPKLGEAAPPSATTNHRSLQGSTSHLTDPLPPPFPAGLDHSALRGIGIDGKETSPPATAARPAPPPVFESRQAIMDEILGSFHGFIAPVKATTGYRVGMIFSLAVMVLMPAVYIGLIVLLAAFLMWYLLSATTLLDLSSLTGEALFMLVLYAVPAIACALLLVFMIKPFLAPAGKGEDERELSRGQEPLMFAFTERLCGLLNAPMPSRILVSSEMQASASFGRDGLSVHIGLALLSGLTLQQFAAVLAHELGHLAQGADLRVRLATTRVERWIYRMIFVRDAWDERLARWSDGQQAHLAFLFVPARFLISTTRMMLYGLTLLGRLFYAPMYRQSEFHSDLHGIRTAGSATFVSMIRSIRLLGFTNQAALVEAYGWSRDKRLADNLPLLTVLRMRELPTKTREELTKKVDETPTGLFDSHPADRDRIARAQAEQASGVFHCIRPASDLLSDFTRLCRETTLDFYHTIYPIKLQLEHLVDTEQLLGQSTASRDTHKSASRYFRQSVDAFRPFLSSNVEIPNDAKACVERIKVLRLKLAEAQEQYLLNVHESYRLMNRGLKALQLGAALEAGFSVGGDTPSEVTERRQEAEMELREVSTRLVAFERGVAQRMLIAVRLLEHPQIQKKIPDAAALSAHAAKLLETARLIDQKLPDMRKLKESCAALYLLLDNYEGGRGNPVYMARVGQRLQKMYDQLVALHGSFEQVDHPLEEGTIPISQYLLWNFPPPDELIQAFSASETFMENCFDLKFKICSKLGEIGEKVELALGLKPLADPNQIEEATEVEALG